MKILILILKEIKDIFFYLIIFLPGRIGILIRRITYKVFAKKCGNNLITEFGIVITGFKNITFGDNCNFMRFCSFNSDGGGQIIFGNNIAVNYNVNTSMLKQLTLIIENYKH